MAKFHVNAKGDAGPCRAQSGKCPFGGESAHYESANEARKAFESQMAGNACVAVPWDPRESMRAAAEALQQELARRALLTESEREAERVAEVAKAFLECYEGELHVTFRPESGQFNPYDLEELSCASLDDFAYVSCAPLIMEDALGLYNAYLNVENRARVRAGEPVEAMPPPACEEDFALTPEFSDLFNVLEEFTGAAPVERNPLTLTLWRSRIEATIEELRQVAATARS